MKNFWVFLVFLVFITGFFTTKNIYADHNCYESCGNPPSCNSSLSCISGICKNAACQSQTDCSCDPYRIQGWKLLKQADQWITATPVNNLNISVDRVGGGYSATKNG